MVGGTSKKILIEAMIMLKVTIDKKKILKKAINHNG